LDDGSRGKSPRSLWPAAFRSICRPIATAYGLIDLIRPDDLEEKSSGIDLSNGGWL